MADMGHNILFQAFCALADGAASVINSSLQHFAEEYEAHVREGRSPLEAPRARWRSAPERRPRSRSRSTARR